MRTGKTIYSLYEIVKKALNDNIPVAIIKERYFKNDSAGYIEFLKLYNKCSEAKAAYQRLATIIKVHSKQAIELNNQIKTELYKCQKILDTNVSELIKLFGKNAKIIYDVAETKLKGLLVKQDLAEANATIALKAIDEADEYQLYMILGIL